MYENTQDEYDALVEVNRKLEAEVERQIWAKTDLRTGMQREIGKLQKAERERDELRALLERYGNHLDDCEGYIGFGFGESEPCTCGWAALGEEVKP
jgi:hypothetical protein